jgi:hypothetical protein
MDYIKNLPEELQRKILYNSMIHPTATLIKNIRKHYDIEGLDISYNIETHKYNTIPLYNLLVLCDILLSSYYYYDDPFMYEL